MLMPSRRNKKVGAIFRSFQIAIILYVLVYAIYLQKGYQGFDTAQSYTSTKIKGLGVSCQVPVANLTACTPANVRVWDVVDYTVPALENNAFFTVTNSLEIPNQVRLLLHFSVYIITAGPKRLGLAA